MKVELVGIDNNAPLDIHNFSNLEGLRIFYAKEEADIITYFTNNVIQNEQVDVNGFYELLEKGLGQTFTRFPLQGKVLIEFISIDKQIVSSDRGYSITFKIKLYLAKDIAE